MSYPINYPTPRGADIQLFQRGGSVSDWVKPAGASFVWFTLIGGGGGGGPGDGAATGGGGGSGAVTNFMCPAFLIPDVLRVSVGVAGTAGIGGDSGGTGGTTSLVFQQKDGTGYTLLSANGGVGGQRGGSNGAGGAAMTANFFTPIGFFQSIAGVGGTGGNPSASATTFLSQGGTGSSAGSNTANYGYQAVGGGSGFGQLQPIIVSVGGCSNATTGGNAGFGSGGGAADVNGSNGGRGGPGLAVIISW